MKLRLHVSDWLQHLREVSPSREPAQHINTFQFPPSDLY